MVTDPKIEITVLSYGVEQKLKVVSTMSVGTFAGIVSLLSGAGPIRPSFHREDGVVFYRGITLEEAGIKDGDVLTLTDVGTGV